jgi:hypothetical protein
MSVEPSHAADVAPIEDFGDDRNHGLFEVADVFGDGMRVPVKSDDGIGDDLARCVERDVTAPVDLHYGR